MVWRHDPPTDWLLLHYLRAVALAALFGVSCLAAGHAALVALLGRTLPLEEHVTIAFALGRFVWPLSLAYSAIYSVGIVLVHAPAGWFVVGAGRNGAEYSVLLIVTLLCVGWQHAPRKAVP